MEEHSTDGGNQLPENNQPESTNNHFNIVGYNMLALVIYTLFTRIGDGAGYLFDALFLVIHVFVCVIVAITSKGMKTWMWVLSAVMVLVIGISTCIYLPQFGR